MHTRSLILQQGVADAEDQGLATGLHLGESGQATSTI
jgi:hypothetical protein